MRAAPFCAARRKRPSAKRAERSSDCRGKVHPAPEVPDDRRTPITVPRDVN